MKEGIERKQIVLIHVAKNQLRLDEKTYRDKILYERYYKRSSKDLTYSQAEDLIRHFKKLGWKPKIVNRESQVVSSQTKNENDSRLTTHDSRKYESLGNRPGMANPGMLRKIEAIWAEVSYSPNLPKSLRSFLWSKFAVSDIIWLDMSTARAVIEALKEMKRRLVKG